jgi:hypothetical protein
MADKELSFTVLKAQYKLMFLKQRLKRCSSHHKWMTETCMGCVQAKDFSRVCAWGIIENPHDEIENLLSQYGSQKGQVFHISRASNCVSCTKSWLLSNTSILSIISSTAASRTPLITLNLSFLSLKNCLLCSHNQPNLYAQLFSMAFN